MTSDLRPFAILSFAYFVTLGMFAPYASLWFQSLGFSTLAIGVIAALQSASRVVAPYGWGWLGDHTGRRVELIRTACLAATLFSALLLGTTSVVWVASVVTLLYLANSAVVPLYEACVGRLLQTPQGMDAQRYGRMRVWGSVGFIVSVAIFGLWFDVLGISTFAAMALVVHLFLVAAAWRLPASPAPTQKGAVAASVWHTLQRAEVRWFFLSVFLTVLAHTVMSAFFSLYLHALGYSATVIGVMWAAAVWAEIVFFWFQGRWLSRLTPHQWLLVVAGVTAVRFAATGGWGSWWWVLLMAQLAHAITFAAHHATCIHLISRYFPDQQRGRGQALYSMLGYGIPGILGGLGGGWLVTYAGFTSVFWVGAICGLLAWAAAWRAAHQAQA